jgi:hypothetical protein
VVVQFTNTFIVIPNETPENEWRDGQWVVTTEQISDLHCVPRGAVYLRGGVFKNSSTNEQRRKMKGRRAYEFDLVVKPKNTKDQKVQDQKWQGSTNEMIQS